jgi:ubiquinone/menaquinone biosynthesis C-methylase UbiE
MNAPDAMGIDIDDVRSFWDENPLCAAAIPHALGSPEYFAHYDAMREANESLAFSSRLHEYPAFTGKKVLDVGSGNGYVLSKYAREGAHVYGVDLTPTAISLCQQRFALLGLRGHFELANAERLPFADNTFDCVCSMGVLHHTPDTATAVEEIFRVLKPGGRLIVMFYHRDSALYRFNFPVQRLLSRKSMQQLVNEVDGVGNPKGHVYSKAELRGLLRRFESIEMFTGLLQGWMVLPRGGRFIPDRLLQRFESRWGWFLYAKGNKPRAATRL